MKKLVCYYSGWFEIPIESVYLMELDSGTDQVKTAKEFMESGVIVENCMIHDVNHALQNATDGGVDEISSFMIEDQ